MSFSPNDIDAFNSDVGKWARESRVDLIGEIRSLGITHRDYSQSPVPAERALRMRITNKVGVASKIGFRMPRHMVFVHKGVGRGTKISQVGTTNRKPKPWFNPVIEKNLPKLSELVADHQGTMILNAVLIK